jgi:hypothetical protein
MILARIEFYTINANQSEQKVMLFMTPKQREKEENKKIATPPRVF